MKYPRCDAIGSFCRWSVLVFCLSLLAMELHAASEVRGVRVQVDFPQDQPAGAWPVTFGVPFPAGVLTPGATVTLQAGGKPIATQTTPLATWDRQGQSVRWLLVDAMIDRPQSQGGMELTWNAPRAKPAAPLAMRREGEHFIIDTGAAQFRVRTAGRFGIDQIRARGTNLIRPQRPIRFVIRDHRGQSYEASGNLTPGGAVVEDHGPVRLTLRSEGWYVNDTGERFCRHDIRLSFYADSPLVRVLHTFIFTEHTDAAKVTDLAVVVPLADSAHEAGFSIDADDLALAKVIANPRDISLVQDYQTRWDLRWTLKDAESDEPVASGGRYGGWAALASKRASVTAAIRDAWQNYPNQMQVRDDALIVHFWPDRGRPLDFSTRAILSVYGEDGTANIDKFFQNQNKPYARSIFDVPNNAMGLAKTHELWLDFAAGPLDVQRSAAVARQAHTPVLAMADPAWIAASNAIGPIHPRDPQRYPEVEAAIDAAFDRFVHWQRRHADYGWLDYGDVHNDARGESFTLKVNGGTIAPPWRYWDSAHYGLPTSLWMLYLRSGERKYLQFAEANTRHCMDIDRCHHGNDVDRFTGTHYYCDWSIIHWGGAPPDYVMLTHYDRLDFMLLAHYLRGERRGLDVMKLWGDAAWRFRDDPNVIFPLKMLPPEDIEHARHYGPNLLNLLELYRATWDERYLTMARDFADALVKLTRLDEPDARLDFSSITFVFEPMLAWWQFTQDDTFRRATVRLAQVHQTSVLGQYNFAAGAVASFMTGDTRYLDQSVATMTRYVSSIHTGPDLAKRGAMGEWAAGAHPFALRSIPILLAALEQAPDAWKQRRLPLDVRSTTLHSPGPRHPTFFLQPVNDSSVPPVLQLHLGRNQRGTLSDPNGRELQVIQSPEDGNAMVEVSIPPASTGIHTLKFDLRPTRSAGDYMERGFVTVVAADGLHYWVGPSTDDGKFTVFAPRLHFRAPSGVEHWEMPVDTHKTWAAYAWHPVVNLYDPRGQVVYTAEGPGPLTLKAQVSQADQGQVWSIGPFSTISAPQVNASWNKPMRDPSEPFPQFFCLPRGATRVSPRHDMLPVDP
jgi:hypothetical protein